MSLLRFANFQYFGVILKGDVYQRAASNTILTTQRGRLLDNRRLLGNLWYISHPTIHALFAGRDYKPVFAGIIIIIIIIIVIIIMIIMIMIMIIIIIIIVIIIIIL